MRNDLKNKDVKQRIELLTSIWDRVLKEWDRGSLTRGRVRDLLKEAYEKREITPLKGASNPPDLYDKELASLYVIGKYGLGLDEEYPELFDKIFSDEIRYEKAVEVLLTMDPGSARDRIVFLLGGKMDDNVIARMFRLELAKTYFGYSSTSRIEAALKAFAKAFPEKEKTVSKYARFYIAFQVASGISRGSIKDRLTKEAVKQALALELQPLKGVIPDDKYIAVIATEVFRIPKKYLLNMLKIGSSRGGMKPKQQG